MRRYGKMLIVFILALEFLAAPTSSHIVSAAGNVYLSPSATTQLPVGSTFSALVKVAGMDQFNGWEIQVVSDPTVIRATSISTAGNIFLANTTGGIGFETRNCVNGSGIGCCLTNACSPVDGVGTADSSYAYTKFANGYGLLFNITFKVVSSKSYSPILIKNDVFSNGGRTDVVHTTTSGSYGSPSSIAVSKFFTDSDFSPLELDSKGNPSVNVRFVKGVVKATDPHKVLAWVNVTNTGLMSLQSLTLNDTLPVDWTVKGAIHVYYANTTSLDANPEITDPTTITMSTGNPQTVSVAIPSFNTTGVGHPLLPGQSILLSVKIKYALKGTSQTFASFPRNYTDTSSASAWAQPSFNGGKASATGSAFFTAYARQLGDFRGDGKVDIFDVGLALGAYGSTPGSPHWLPLADFNDESIITLNDVNLVISNFGAGC